MVNKARRNDALFCSTCKLAENSGLPQAMDDIRFKKNNKRYGRSRILSVFSSLLAIVTILLGILIKSTPATIFGVIYLGFGIYLIVRSYSKKDTVIVNKEGIYTYVNGAGLIPWEFIEGFKIKKAVNNTCLVIKVNDVEKLLSTKNKVSQKLMKSNIKCLGSPVVIPYSEFYESLILVQDKLEEYRGSL